MPATGSRCVAPAAARRSVRRSVHRGDGIRAASATRAVVGVGETTGFGGIVRHIHADFRCLVLFGQTHGAAELIESFGDATHSRKAAVPTSPRSRARRWVSNAGARESATSPAPSTARLWTRDTCRRATRSPHRSASLWHSSSSPRASSRSIPIFQLEVRRFVHAAMPSAAASSSSDSSRRRARSRPQ